jgi:hypothetical protein
LRVGEVRDTGHILKHGRLLALITDDEGSLRRSFPSTTSRSRPPPVIKDGVVVVLADGSAADVSGLAFFGSEALLFETGFAAALVAVPEHE